MGRALRGVCIVRVLPPPTPEQSTTGVISMGIYIYMYIYICIEVYVKYYPTPNEWGAVLIP